MLEVKHSEAFTFTHNVCCHLSPLYCGLIVGLHAAECDTAWSYWRINDIMACNRHGRGGNGVWRWLRSEIWSVLVLVKMLFVSHVVCHDWDCKIDLCFCRRLQKEGRDWRRKRRKTAAVTVRPLPVVTSRGCGGFKRRQLLLLLRHPLSGRTEDTCHTIVT